MPCGVLSAGGSQRADGAQPDPRSAVDRTTAADPVDAANAPGQINDDGN